MARLSNRNADVTGAAVGIGTAAAVRFVAQRATALCSGTAEEPLKEGGGW